jgi:hypothetical protein
VHATGSKLSMHLVTLLCLAILASGALAARATLRAPAPAPPAPPESAPRARFLALGGLVMDGFFLLVIVAEAIPTLMLGARQ